MASYFISWLNGGGVTPTTPVPVQVDETPSIDISEPSPPASPIEEEYDDDDRPAMFPSLSSAQRSAGSRSDMAPPSFNRSPSSMPPPALPTRLTEGSGPSLMLPPSTTKPMPNTNRKGKVREKVALAPGHSALDWARLKSSGADLRGVTTLQRVTPTELRKHNKSDDAWSAFYGKVYNITPYLPFHPGGQRELMRAAGRDGTKLFATTHSWVNLDFMLDECLVGFLVPEEKS